MAELVVRAYSNGDGPEVVLLPGVDFRVGMPLGSVLEERLTLFFDLPDLPILMMLMICLLVGYWTIQECF